MYYIKINKLLEDSKQKDYFSKNDLYVKINYIEDNKVKSKKTQIIYNNNKPIWDEIFLLEKVTNIEIILYEKGKFMDRLINSKKISLNLKELIKENIINIEIIHGEVLFEDKKLREKLLNENSNLKKEMIKKEEFINKLSIEKDNTIKELRIDIEKKENNIKEMKLDIEKKSNTIKNIKKYINNI